MNRRLSLLKVASDGSLPESRASPEDLASRGVVQESDPCC